MKSNSKTYEILLIIMPTTTCLINMFLYSELKN